jgi:hypothetical protein
VIGFDGIELRALYAAAQESWLLSGRRLGAKRGPSENSAAENNMRFMDTAHWAGSEVDLLTFSPPANSVGAVRIPAP